VYPVITSLVSGVCRSGEVYLVLSFSVFPVLNWRVHLVLIWSFFAVLNWNIPLVLPWSDFVVLNWSVHLVLTWSVFVFLNSNVPLVLNCSVLIRRCPSCCVHRLQKSNTTCSVSHNMYFVNTVYTLHASIIRASSSVHIKTKIRSFVSQSFPLLPTCSQQVSRLFIFTWSHSDTHHSR
jgi:hypothetical protein